MGLGGGYLSHCLPAAAVARGELVIRQTEEPKVGQQLAVAWRTAHKGKALKWFVGQIGLKGWFDRALRMT